MKRWSDELLIAGRKPFVIPIGGSTGLGALGYVKAMEELSYQCKHGNVQIILGVGSCGTFAGAILGAQIFIPDARVIGISVSRTAEAIRKRTLELIEESAELINHKISKNINIECYDDYHIEYGLMTDAGKQAIELAANLEGVLLDPIYTGKVMAGLVDLSKKNIINKNIPVVFIHTGGLPIIFSFDNELGKTINCRKIYPAK